MSASPPAGLDALVTPYQAWRARARAFLQQEIRPEVAPWQGESLLPAGLPGLPSSPTRVSVPSRLVDLFERAACHRDPAREPLMYRLLWRVVHGSPGLVDDAADMDVMAVARLAKSVDRAVHKMRAFVRFREIAAPDGERYLAWFEPEHDVLVRNATFFVNRFAGMHWTIATPDGALAWDRTRLRVLDVDSGIELPQADAAEPLWLAYYEHIFNPARLNVAMMRKEMPLRYWKNLPEAARIPALVTDAMERTGRMVEETMVNEKPRRGIDRTTMAAAVEDPGRPTKAALDACRRCPLGAMATQGVPGTGPVHAEVMLVGEQPGDEEDLAGKPFVGPAGKVLRRALEEARIDVASVYVTNAVKHFSFEPRGKRRIHKTPAQREIEACRGWLEAEIIREGPMVIVALGATALQALLGKRMGVGVARAMELTHARGARVVATYHPSAVLRDPTEEGRALRYATIVADLRRAMKLQHGRKGS